MASLVPFEMSECFSLGDLEKQISVDPISLKESSHKDVSVESVDPVVGMPAAVAAPKPNGLPQLPPLLPPAGPKFLSFSLPNSANSSPRSSSLLKKKPKNVSPPSPLQFENQDHLQREIQYRRSKSCGQGRAFAPSVDFDLWLVKPNATERHYSNLSRNEPTNNVVHKNGKKMEPCDDGFTCGALCLFLPGFGKAKPVRARKVEPDELGNVISRTVSLEKFECGSWASVMINEQDDDSSISHYFDLPLELIRSSVNDADSPISTSFVFDTDRKGVLKNSSARAYGRKSHESSRHVRFSTSSTPTSPTFCVTPRLLKARNDFRAFLEAQST